MKALEKIQSSFDSYAEQIAQYLERLSLRERIMVIFTVIFSGCSCRFSIVVHA